MSARQTLCALVVLGVGSLACARLALAASSAESRPSTASDATYDQLEHMMDLHRASRWLIMPPLDVKAAGRHGGAWVEGADVPRARFEPLRPLARAQHSERIVAALGPGSWQD